MFNNFIRDMKIRRNHRRRVGSVIIRSNEEIIRTLDVVKAKYLEAERKEEKDAVIKYRSMLDILEWLINEI